MLYTGDLNPFGFTASYAHIRRGRSMLCPPRGENPNDRANSNSNFGAHSRQGVTGLKLAPGMKITRSWKVILPIAIAIVVAMVSVWLWLSWASISFRYSLHKLDGDLSGGEDWNFPMNIFSDGISSREVAEFDLAIRFRWDIFQFQHELAPDGMGRRFPKLWKED